MYFRTVYFIAVYFKTAQFVEDSLAYSRPEQFRPFDLPEVSRSDLSDAMIHLEVFSEVSTNPQELLAVKWHLPNDAPPQSAY